MGRAFNLLHLASAGKIDIFPLGRDAFHHSELARSAEQDWAVPGQASIRLRVASAEDTVLSWEWLREWTWTGPVCGSGRHGSAWRNCSTGVFLEVGSIFPG